ncbi:MAG TPA: CoA transferase [Pseudomonadales bacterium]|nr:CoA transferase [Pseudomonadales bacterium]
MSIQDDEPRRQPDGALTGVRVIDCTHVIAGAYCSMLLADLGADVIKIEPLDGEGGREAEVGPFRAFDFINRNKRAIAVDLQRAEGVALVRSLAAGADIFVENFRPGAFDRLGLGYDALRSLNPRLIYCSISGFGHSGPYRDRGGFDLVAQAMGGIMSLTGEKDAARPVAAGVPFCDFSAGTFGALGALAALNRRYVTGLGQKVEATLLESGMAHAVWEAGIYTTTGAISGPVGSAHRLAAPYEAFATADGFIVVGVATQKIWTKFCIALDARHLETDPRFATELGRLEHRDALKVLIEAVLAQNTSRHWLDRLLGDGVPAGPINDIAQAVEDPHIVARGLIVDVDGERYTRAPIGLSDTPVALRRGAARVGEHTREVLREAGLDDDRIAALERSGVVSSRGDS